jgi:hypothetical protein
MLAYTRRTFPVCYAWVMIRCGRITGARFLTKLDNFAQAVFRIAFSCLGVLCAGHASDRLACWRLLQTSFSAYLVYHVFAPQPTPPEAACQAQPRYVDRSAVCCTEQLACCACKTAHLQVAVLAFAHTLAARLLLLASITDVLLSCSTATYRLHEACKYWVSAHYICAVHGTSVLGSQGRAFLWLSRSKAVLPASVDCACACAAVSYFMHVCLGAYVLLLFDQARLPINRACFGL